MNSMPDGTYGDGIGRVDEMDRAGESGEVLCEPLYPGVIVEKYQDGEIKGLSRRKKRAAGYQGFIKKARHIIINLLFLKVFYRIGEDGE
ncbi:hypothetical protein H9X98_18000 [Aeromonas jandaei]|uniref:hypothetical protein n=1 Tax=Aeromonas jandaei TaxID=650 RepID=UPI001F3BA04E|nr:hypothetical protein [Aeromonas jandaei]MCF7719565.1 hypothetical protein [Aeromonas jandaei]